MMQVTRLLTSSSRTAMALCNHAVRTLGEESFSELVSVVATLMQEAARVRRSSRVAARAQPDIVRRDRRVVGRRAAAATVIALMVLVPVLARREELQNLVRAGLQEGFIEMFASTRPIIGSDGLEGGRHVGLRLRGR